MKKFLKSNVLKSWKTTMAGLTVGVLVALNYIGTLTEQQTVFILGLLTSLGFVASKDGNVSHTLFPTDDKPKEPKQK
jgi:hypothetical protein